MERYWGNYIGDTDDSLILLAYLSGKGNAALSLREILSDFGLDLHGNIRQTDPPLSYTTPEGWEMDIHCAIDLVMDLAALLLACRTDGSVSLLVLGEETGLPGGCLRITASPEELEDIGRVLADFAVSPASYDLSGLMDEEDLSELAGLLGALRKELCG